MTDDARMTWDLIFEVLDVLDRHGYRRSDNQHTSRAIGLLGDRTRTYEGTKDAPRDAHVVIPRRRRQQPSHAATTPSSCRPPRSRPLLPRLTRPHFTSGTESRCAPTAPISPAAPANGASKPPAPTTS